MTLLRLVFICILYVYLTLELSGLGVFQEVNGAYLTENFTYLHYHLSSVRAREIRNEEFSINCLYGLIISTNHYMTNHYNQIALTFLQIVLLVVIIVTMMNYDTYINNMVKKKIFCCLPLGFPQRSCEG